MGYKISIIKSKVGFTANYFERRKLTALNQLVWIFGWLLNLENFKLIGHNDSDNGGSTDGRKITSLYTFHFGTGVVLWASKKQTTVAMSQVEAEYVATISTACQSTWMRKMLEDLLHNK